MRKQIGDINQFKGFLIRITENPYLTTNIEIRRGQYSYLTASEAEMIRHWLNDIEVEFEDRFVHGDTHSIRFILEGMHLVVWYEKKKTKEEQIADLKEQLAKLEATE